MAVTINGTPFALQYKRTTSRPIDATSVFATLEDATIYARNTDTTAYVPYPSQIIGVIENSGVYVLVKDETISNADGRNHCKLVSIGNSNITDDKYLSREEEDTARELIHFLKGIDAQGESMIEKMKIFSAITSNNYVANSNGFSIHKTDSGQWEIEIDNIIARNKFTTDTLEIQQSKYIGGGHYATKAGIVIDYVEELRDGYKCYFKNEDKDGNEIHNQFVINDLAFCRQTNTTASRNYWLLVTDIGINYITLSITEGTGNDIPKKGDNVIQLGHKTDIERQSALIFDDESIAVYNGINNYYLPTPDIYLNAYESTIKAKLINSATGNEINEDLRLMRTDLNARISEIKTQQDRSFTIWMESYAPLTTNLPASDWDTEDLKKEHLQDIFYNTSSTNGVGGRAYRYEYDSTNGYYWKEITDKDTIAALEQAQKAEDLADKKRRIFVEQPTSADSYDVGDMWVNATYSTTYDNDTLVCVVAKNAGAAFNIQHWKAAQYTTTAVIKNLGNEISQYVTDANLQYESVKKIAEQGIEEANIAYNKAVDGVNDAAEALGKAKLAYDLADTANIAASSNTTVIQQNTNSIAALTQKINFNSSNEIINIYKGDLVLSADFNTLLSKKVTFDTSGNITNYNKSGLVTTANFNQLFSEAGDTNGYVKRAEISTFITQTQAGQLISNATIQADKINFSGKTIINGKFIVDTNGNLTMNNATMNDAIMNNCIVQSTGNNVIFNLNPSNNRIKMSVNNTDLCDFYVFSEERTTINGGAKYTVHQGKLILRDYDPYTTTHITEIGADGLNVTGANGNSLSIGSGRGIIFKEGDTTYYGYSGTINGMKFKNGICIGTA